MLKCHVLSGVHREFAVSSKARHASNDSRGLSSFCGFSCNSTVRENPTGIRSMQTWSSSVKTHANRGSEAEAPETENEGSRIDTFERPRIVGGSGEMAEADELIRSHELTQVVGKCNEVEWRSDARAREMHEDLSYQEMMERWEFLKRLPHKLLRDIGYIIAGPSLLSTSKELPTVNTSTLGGSRHQWPGTKAWLRQLSISALEAWFASHRSSQRLGDHFALCIEYVLRHSPHVEVQHLLTSQQVLQRVTEPVRSSKALKALEAKSLAQDQPLLSLRGSTSVDETVQLLESVDLREKNSGLRGGTSPPQENAGKRKRKLLKKLERIRLRKGKTHTLGEFDYLFETSPGVQSQWAVGSEGKELHHWEVSVKFLLYVGPWEVFGGLQTPQSAAWSRDPSSRDPSSRVVDEFLGCYLGPHVGETLLDRKARLCNQLALSANPCAALMLRGLYQNQGATHADSRNTLNELQSVDMAEGTQEDGDGGGDGGKPEHLRVVPSALLKGYLFYEYKLWHFLESSDGLQNSTANSLGETMQAVERASLSKDHWMGWWTRDIMEFADSPRHRHSRWYIVPKLEWLSPVVIPLSDPGGRCARVLSLPDFLLAAALLAEEAARLHMPRKRRFLVAELRWTPEWEPCRVSAPVDDEPTIQGAWLEVSRGFLVEDTWPASRMYRPHGFVVSGSSPSLQGSHPDV